MASLFNVVTGQRSMPKHIPTDTIIPLHSRDDTPQNRSISVNFTMRFDEVLGSQWLADSLWKLLEKPGWRKLGARLRLNNDTRRLEYHIPAQYTKDRPPINFSQKTHNMRLDEHPVGRQFPNVKDNGQVQSFDIAFSLNALTRREDTTTFLEDWIYSDKAQLSLDVVNFQDATLVTLTWLHTLLDGMGRRMLLDAWIAVLEGRDEDVPEFWGYDSDPLDKLGAPLEDDTRPVGNGVEQKKKQSAIWAVTLGIKNWLVKLLSFKSFFTYLYSRIFKPTPETGRRVLYMPRSYLAQLRTEAMRDVASLDTSQITYNTSNPSDPKPFLSDGDIISAWLAKHIASCNRGLLQSPPARPIVVINVLGMRDLLSKATEKFDILIPKDKAYVGNCAAGIPSAFSLGQFLSHPLGHVAARLRKDIVQQATRETLEASQRALRSGPQISAAPSDASMAPVKIVLSNWAKAKFFDTDFSAAIVSGGDASNGERATRGKPTYIHVFGTDARGKDGLVGSGGMGNIVGKDANGGYWIGGVVPKEYELDFEKAVLGG